MIVSSSNSRIKTPIILNQHKKSTSSCDTGHKKPITKIPFYIGGNNIDEVPRLPQDHFYKLGIIDEKLVDGAGIQVITSNKPRINIHGDNTVNYTQPCGLGGRVVISNGMIEQKEIYAMKIIQNRDCLSNTVRFIDIYLPCPSNAYTLVLDDADGIDIGNNTVEIYINNIFLGTPPSTVYDAYTMGNVTPTSNLELDINNFFFTLKLLPNSITATKFNVRFTYPGSPPSPYDCYAGYKFGVTRPTINYSPYMIPSVGMGIFQFQVIPNISNLSYNMLHITIHDML